ncbi:MAG: hypothetical protein IPI44_21295 [Sulfuritalea sp.]|nr:hypothetical protein [Sulfuritalea sp.]
MSSTPKQNPSLHAMTQGFSQVLSEQASQWPMTPGGPVAAALSLGSEDHGTLRQEWLEGQAELWQAMLEQAVARAGQKVAASPRDDQSFDDPMRGQNDMSDYLRPDQCRLPEKHGWDGAIPAGAVRLSRQQSRASRKQLSEDSRQAEIWPYFACKGTYNLSRVPVVLLLGPAFVLFGVLKLGTPVSVVEATPPVVRCPCPNWKLS